MISGIGDILAHYFILASGVFTFGKVAHSKYFTMVLYNRDNIVSIAVVVAAALDACHMCLMLAVFSNARLPFECLPSVLMFLLCCDACVLF